MIFSNRIHAQSSSTFSIPLKTYYQARHNAGTEDDSTFSCEMESTLPNITFDYGWNMYLVESRNVGVWAGVSFLKDFVLYQDIYSLPLLTVRARIGGGLFYFLAEATGKFYLVTNKYFSFGLSYQQFFDGGDLGRYDYNYSPYIERKYWNENTFFVFGYGAESNDSFIEFQLRTNLKESIITPWYEYNMTPEPMRNIAPKRYFSLAVLWGMHF